MIDITERKLDEDRRMLLIHELNHRVKNTLAVVQSLASQGLRSNNDPAAFKEVFVRRLTALSHAHDLLTLSNWTGADFMDVVIKALSGFAGVDRYKAVGPSVRLPPRAVAPLSMALHELATNASKYGSLSAEDGTVAVDWQFEPASILKINWIERGGPPVATPRRRGFGSRLIEQGLRYELDGEIDLDFSPSGLRCRMVIPLTETKYGFSP